MNPWTTGYIIASYKEQYNHVHEAMYWVGWISHTGSYTYKWDVLEQKLEQAV